MKLFRGTFIHSLGLDELQVLKDTLIGVDEKGSIVFIESVNRLDTLIQSYAIEPIHIITLKEYQIMIPGFIDTHIHAPQYTFTGTGYDKSLLDWLNTYTFPQESKFKEPVHASENYPKVVCRSLQFGTTTACYYGTIHVEACKILVATMEKFGQRGCIGKVNMDRNSPDYYVESTSDSMQATKEFVAYVKSRKNNLIQPVITPRFVPSCTPELMQFLGDYAKQNNLLIQSHISENLSEIEWVKGLHTDCDGYGDVYQKYGLLNENSIMAHSIYLTASERKLFKTLNVGISHCPNSNFSLQSGVCNVRRLFQEGIQKVGLGTDVGGGYSPSILDAMRQAVIASKVIHIQDDKYAPLNISEAFYLATLGGSKVLNMDKRIGNFMVGKCFDALLIDLHDASKDRNSIDVFTHDSILSLFEKFIYLGDDRNIKQVFVNGEKVISTD